MEMIVIEKRTVGNEEINSIDARELHATLGLKSEFANWIKGNIKKLNLVENVDYVTVDKIVSGGKFAPIEYTLTLDAGKHIAMMTNTTTAHEVRTYFIEFEKKAKALLINTEPLTPQQLLAQAVLMSQSIIAEKDLQLEQKDKFIAVIQPKAAALDKISIADGEMCISNAAKILGYQKIKDCFAWLHEIKWIFKRGGDWIAHQETQRAGLMKMKTVTFESSDGSEKAKGQALITPKGLTKLAAMLENREMVAA